MLNFDMCEESRVAEIRFTAWADVVSIVGFVSSSSASATLLKRMLKTSWKHNNINLLIVKAGYFLTQYLFICSLPNPYSHKNLVE